MKQQKTIIPAVLLLSVTPFLLLPAMAQLTIAPHPQPTPQKNPISLETRLQ